MAMISTRGMRRGIIGKRAGRKSRHTSCFQFMRTTVQESLDFVGSDVRSQPGVGPGGFRGARVLDDGGFGGFLGGIGVFTPEDTGEEGHCDGGRQLGLRQRLQQKERKRVERDGYQRIRPNWAKAANNREE